MAEEKKEEKAASQEAAPQKAEAPAQAPEAQAVPVQADKPKVDKKIEKVERPANCASCNKPIKKKWYYRNGKYFCTKRCWKVASEKEEKKPDAEAQTPSK